MEKLVCFYLAGFLFPRPFIVSSVFPDHDALNSFMFSTLHLTLRQKFHKSIKLHS